MNNDINWQDWHWQIKNSIKSIDELKKQCNLTEEQMGWINDNFSSNHLPFSVTPFFASLIAPSLFCPIFKQVIPSTKEEFKDQELYSDPLGEDGLQTVPHLVHRYPDRVLFLLTDRCASYCRFCTRKRLVGQGPTPKKEDHEKAFLYIKNNQKIREIIFSGGDPLLCSDDIIFNVLKNAFSLSNIEVVRFHSRVLSFVPMRVTEKLCEIFSQFSPIYLVTHFNHPKEITDEAIFAINRLIKSGVVVQNQSVLLAGINDDTDILTDLFRKLVKNRVRPYYLHSCDLVSGSSHFRVPLKKSLAILKSLRGNISGLCLPTFVIDIPQGLGKVPLVPDPIVKEDEDFIYLEGFSKKVGRYPKK